MKDEIRVQKSIKISKKKLVNIKKFCNKHNISQPIFFDNLFNYYLKKESTSKYKKMSLEEEHIAGEVQRNLFIKKEVLDELNLYKTAKRWSLTTTINYFIEIFFK